MRGKPISLEMVRTVKTLNAIRAVRETRRDALHRSIRGSSRRKMPAHDRLGPQFDGAGCHNASIPLRLRRSPAPTIPVCSTCRAILLNPSASNATEAAVRINVRSVKRGDNLKSRTGRSGATFFSATSHAIAVFSSPSWIDQLEVYRLPSGENAPIGDFLELCHRPCRAGSAPDRETRRRNPSLGHRSRPAPPDWSVHIRSGPPSAATISPPSTFIPTVFRRSVKFGY